MAKAARWESPEERLVASVVTGVIPGIKKTAVADGAGYGVEVVKVAKAGRAVSGAARGVAEEVETAQERAQRLYIEKMEKKK